MKAEEIYCPLTKCGYCLEEFCPFWHQSSTLFAGCILKTILWSSREILNKPMAELNTTNQDIRDKHIEKLPCPSIELDGEVFDLLIQDPTRIMEITDRLRKCKGREDLKQFAEEEAYKEFPGIQILN